MDYRKTEIKITLPNLFFQNRVRQNQVKEKLEIDTLSNVEMRMFLLNNNWESVKRSNCL
jgi:hypothetical protein